MLSSLLTSFSLGLLTPLTAVCVLPLYPGYLAYLGNKLSLGEGRIKPFYFGLIITLGVIIFMMLIGILFTTLLNISLTRVIGIISPVAFILLSVISLFLIFDVEIGSVMPRVNIPTFSNPWASALAYGFFFGAIVIPCNPLFIAALFTRSVLVRDFISSITNFFAFGVGIGTPLLLFSVLSATMGGRVIQFLVRRKRVINLFSGVAMLAISVYYLIFVFKVLG